jgi:hypothetical protein
VPQKNANRSGVIVGKESGENRIATIGRTIGIARNNCVRIIPTIAGKTERNIPNMWAATENYNENVMLEHVIDAARER